MTALSAQSQIRVGIIGHGLAGAILHAPLIEALDAFRIVAVATSRPETLAMRRDAPRAIADPMALVEAADVDLVVIASPNTTHFPLAKAALLAGKAVVIDKPFVVTLAEADELIALAEDKRAVLSVFHNRRWDGDFIAVREKLRSKTLGNVSLFESRWDRFRPEAAAVWRNSAEPGAGLLWDLGPHLIDQALLLFGKPDAMHADLATQRSAAVSDDYFELTLRYGAMRCILSASTLVAAPRPRFAVYGDAGAFLAFGPDPTEEALRAGARLSDADFSSKLPPIQCRHHTPDAAREETAPAGHWTAYYEALAACLRDQGPAPVDLHDAREVIRIIEEAHAMARAAS